MKRSSSIHHYPAISEYDITYRRHRVGPVLKTAAILVGAVGVIAIGAEYLDYRERMGVKDSYESPPVSGTVLQGSVGPQENKYLTQVKPEPTLESLNQEVQHKTKRRGKRHM
jgi:hypothetical protein